MAYFNGYEGVWRYVGGRRIFIRDKQSLSDAMKLSGKFPIQIKNTETKKKETQQEIEEKIIDTINNGQVFEFSVGPQMTICSRYEKGDYKILYSSGDCPMGFFEREIVPYLKDEFVVVDDGISKIPKTSRFKKYGYEVVGETNEKDKDIMQGVYTNKDPGYIRNKWYLMRKKDK